MPEARVDWNDDQVEQLKTMWAGGQSCSQIARQIAGATRSAVLGKVHRLQLPERASRQGQRNDLPAPPVKTSKPKPPVPVQRPTMSLEPPLVLENGAFVTLETVTDRTCRWPIGEPQDREFHFCGNAPKTGKPYCEAHCKIVYQPLAASARQVGEQDGRRANGKRYPARRGQVSMWE
jgi:GcrA cell cycle regulator